MDIMEVQFIGGPLDGFSFAYTQDDLPLQSFRNENQEIYVLNSIQLQAWKSPRFIYLHNSLKIPSLNLAK